MDPIRRSILATGVAATAVATAPARLLAQNVGAGAIPMGLYETGTVRIHFEEAGSGFPLLVIAGGGLNSTIANLSGNSPFDPMQEFKAEYRCIASDCATPMADHPPARSRQTGRGTASTATIPAC